MNEYHENIMSDSEHGKFWSVVVGIDMAPACRAHLGVILAMNTGSKIDLPERTEAALATMFPEVSENK